MPFPIQQETLDGGGFYNTSLKYCHHFVQIILPEQVVNPPHVRGKPLSVLLRGIFVPVTLIDDVIALLHRALFDVCADDRRGDATCVLNLQGKI
jgi:hypothetical protein